MTAIHHLLSRASLTGVLAAAALAAVPTAQAGVVVGWAFDNATTNQLTNIAASTMASGVTNASFSAPNHGVVDWHGALGNKVLLTRFFDNGTTVPSMSFTLADTLDNLTLSFTTYHNHNPGFPTYQQYKYAVQINDGSGWTNLMADLIASNATRALAVDVPLTASLGPGTYSMRWIGYGYAYGTNSNTEYFALDNVTLSTATAAANTVPEPASLALVGLALAGVAAMRRKRA